MEWIFNNIGSSLFRYFNTTDIDINYLLPPIEKDWTIINYNDISDKFLTLYLNPTQIDSNIVLYLLLYDPSLFQFIVYYKIVDNTIELWSNGSIYNCKNELYNDSFRIIGTITHININYTNISGNISKDQTKILLSIFSDRYFELVT